MDAEEKCSETLLERLEPEIVLLPATLPVVEQAAQSIKAPATQSAEAPAAQSTEAPAAKPVVTPVTPTPPTPTSALRQPEAPTDLPAGGQQNLVQPVTAPVQQNIVQSVPAPVQQYLMAATPLPANSFVINPTSGANEQYQGQIIITVLSEPTQAQQQTLEDFDRDINNILAGQETENELIENQKREDELARQKKEQEELKERQLKELERQRKEQEDKEKETQQRIQKIVDERKRQEEEAEKLQERQKEQLQKKQRAEFENLKKSQERRQQWQLEEEKRVQELRAQQLRDEAIQTQQPPMPTYVQPAPLIHVISIERLQKRVEEPRQPAPVHQNELAAPVQHRAQEPPQHHTQPFAPPRQAPVCLVGPRSTVPQPVHQTIETPESSLKTLCKAASFVIKKITMHDTQIRAMVTFKELFMSDGYTKHLVNCDFRYMLRGSLPKSCSDWENMIHIVFMAIKFLSPDLRSAFYTKLQDSGLSQRLVEFLMQINEHSKRIFLLPLPKVLKKDNISWAKNPDTESRPDSVVLDEFIKKLRTDRVLRPERTAGGSLIVITPQLHCQLLQVLLDAYIEKYVSTEVVEPPPPPPPEPVPVQPVASTSRAIDLMVINPHASFLSTAAPLPATQVAFPRTESVIQHSTMTRANADTIVNTTVVSQTVHHRPAVPQPAALTMTRNDAVSQMVENMVYQVQQPPLPLQPPPQAPPPPPPPTYMMVAPQPVTNHATYVQTQQQPPHYYQRQYQPTQTQTINWGPNYDNPQMYRQARQDCNSQQARYGQQQQQQNYARQPQQQYQYHNQQQIPNAHQQQQIPNAQRQQLPPSYQHNVFGQRAVQQPQQAHFQQPAPTVAQMPVVSPTVPGNLDYLHNFGLRFEQQAPDVNTNVVSMEIDGDRVIAEAIGDDSILDLPVNYPFCAMNYIHC